MSHDYLAVRVRPMTVGDIDKMLELSARLPQAPGWHRSAWLAAADPRATPLRFGFVAEMAPDGCIAGFAVACKTGAEAELETIAVAPEFQRRGVALQLLAEIANTLRLAKAIRITLEVRASNEAALALYQSLGFVRTGSRPRYYSDPVEDAILMELALAPP